MKNAETYRDIIYNLQENPEKLGKYGSAIEAVCRVQDPERLELIERFAQKMEG